MMNIWRTDKCGKDLMDIQLMTQYSVLGLTSTTHVDVPLITEQDILFLQKEKQLMQFSTLSWRKKNEI